jgi:hypothetical protein
MRYDFRADVPIVHRWLRDAVQEYRAKHLRSPAEFPELTRVELAFLCGDGTTPATLYLDMDDRPDAEADGDATFRCVAELKRPGWSAFLLPPKGDRQFVATLPDGSVREGDDETDAICADALAGLLLSAKAAGVFDALPAAADLMLDVTYQGDRVWPPYDEDGARAEA